MKRQHLSFGQRVQIYNFIKTIGKVNDGLWIYNEGWSDARVAQQFKTSTTIVGAVRLELGKIINAPNAPYALKLADLEQRIAVLENNLAELTLQLSRLKLKEHFTA